MKKTRTMRTAACSVAAVLTLGTAATLLSACTEEARSNETTPLTLASDLFDGFGRGRRRRRPDADRNAFER